jgi:hypothetical protein
LLFFFKFLLEFCLLAKILCDLFHKKKNLIRKILLLGVSYFRGGWAWGGLVMGADPRLLVMGLWGGQRRRTGS